MLVFIFLLSFSSAVFELKTVEIFFLSPENRPINISSNSVFNTQEKISKVISSADFQFGKLMFLQEKDKYIIDLERNNPYLETLKIEAVFPNKFVIKARERLPVFYISNEETKYILDKDYKILEISSAVFAELQIPILFKKNGAQETFFSFFSLSPLALTAGQFLSENNLVFSSISLWQMIYEFNLSSDISALTINETTGTVFIEIDTKNASYGVKLALENVLNSFDKKFRKLLSALLTLREKERIKTTYGKLFIDDACNCYWNNL